MKIKRKEKFLYWKKEHLIENIKDRRPYYLLCEAGKQMLDMNH